MDPQAGPMLRQMEQLGMTNVKYFGGDGICTPRSPSCPPAPRRWAT